MAIELIPSHSLFCLARIIKLFWTVLKIQDNSYFVSNYDFKSQIGNNIFSSYQKSLSIDRVILANSAMPNNVKQAAMANEALHGGVRIIQNYQAKYSNNPKFQSKIIQKCNAIIQKSEPNNPIIQNYQVKYSNNPLKIWSIIQ